MRQVVRNGLLAFFASVTLAAGQQLDSVSTALASRLQQAGRSTVAVVDFTDLQGGATELGRYLAEELSVTLAMSAKGFTVIDRTHLKAILQEHKLGASGLIDSLTARQLGKIAGVDTLITGTLTPFGDSVRLTVKALDSQTAGMLAATSADIPRTKAIEELLIRAVGGPPTSQIASSLTTSTVPLQRMQGAGVTLEIEGCRKSGTCQLFATAEEDTRFTVGGVWPARAWDRAGNEYVAKMIRIGNREWGGDLVAGVRTPVTISFEFSHPSGEATGFGSGRSGTQRSGPVVEVEALTAIEVAFNGVGGRTLTGRFRNIAVR